MITKPSEGDIKCHYATGEEGPDVPCIRVGLTRNEQLMRMKFPV